MEKAKQIVLCDDLENNQNIRFVWSHSSEYVPPFFEHSTSMTTQKQTNWKPNTNTQKTTMRWFFFLSAKILITGLLFSSYKVRKQVIVWIIDYECRSSYHLMWVCVCVWASERQKKYCTSYQICWIFVYFECVAQLHGTNGCVDNFNMQVFFI